MKQLLALASIGVIAACSSAPDPAPTKEETKQVKTDGIVLEPVYRAAKAIEGAISVGVTYQQFLPLLQEFATQLAIAADKATVAERDPLQLYSAARDAYRDSATLWRAQIEYSDDTWQGQIPYKIRKASDKQIIAIIERYGLASEERKIKYTGERFSSVSPNSIRILWEHAYESVGKASTLSR